MENGKKKKNHEKPTQAILKLVKKNALGYFLLLGNIIF